jgi:hypothetical protein
LFFGMLIFMMQLLPCNTDWRNIPARTLLQKCLFMLYSLVRKTS